MDRKGVKVGPLVEILCSTQCVGVVREEDTASERDEEANIKVRNDYKQNHVSETWQTEEMAD